MMRRVLVICAAVCTLAATSASLAQEQKFMVVAFGSLNTMGRLFPSPNASDPVSRNTWYGYEDFYGAGIEVRYYLPNSNVFLGLSSEYIRNSGGRTAAAIAQTTIPVEDSYQVIPIEFTGYFRIPVTTGAFSAFMGAGAGLYFGERDYTYAGVAAPTTSSKSGYGIHVLGGIAYDVTSWCGASFELKFRDAQFETTNAFKVSSARYNNILVPLPQPPFTSSIHTDGMVIQFGLGIRI
jgi:hypothetical protein